MTTILANILATKREEIAEAKRLRPLVELEQQLPHSPPVRDFTGALRSDVGTVRLIAEIKRASPSAGLIRPDFDPVLIAQAYRDGGAACLSVLTDTHYFQGKLEYLRSVRAICELPLLRKDFIIDPYQLVEARVAGADCVLLIAECLDGSQLLDLYQAATDLGMHTLIELYDRENLPAVLATNCPLIGVNNRDLRTFKTDLHHTIALRSEIPAERVLVAESGIRSNQDVQRLAEAGVQAMLVGESLMRQPDLVGAVKELLQ
ncbi:indole-3-glycerol phosphate synthase TrpC [Planctomycetaceae bacterium SH139]